MSNSQAIDRSAETHRPVHIGQATWNRMSRVDRLRAVLLDSILASLPAPYSAWCQSREEFEAKQAFACQRAATVYIDFLFDLQQYMSKMHTANGDTISRFYFDEEGYIVLLGRADTSNAVRNAV